MCLIIVVQEKSRAGEMFRGEEKGKDFDWERPESCDNWPEVSDQATKWRTIQRFSIFFLFC